MSFDNKLFVLSVINLYNASMIKHKLINICSDEVGFFMRYEKRPYIGLFIGTRIPSIFREIRNRAYICRENKYRVRYVLELPAEAVTSRHFFGIL